MTGKLKLGERDWLWPLHHSQWKSKKSDWLNLDLEVVRETTRHEKKHFHVRNYSESFRELRRLKRSEKAQQKFEALAEDRHNVIGNALRPADFILNGKPKSPNMPLKEARDLLRTSHRLKNDVARLVGALSGSTGDINALWRVIETVGLIGRFMGTHPLKAQQSANAHEPWWHKPAISRAAEIRKKHPDPGTYSNYRVAGDIYKELKGKQDGPSSARAVDKALGRKLWTTGAGPTK
jgi:hypothetical protein